jgi:Sec-independent protein translocase protein TatA
MTYEEMTREIGEGAREFRRLMEDVRAKKSQGQPLN